MKALTDTSCPTPSCFQGTAPDQSLANTGLVSENHCGVTKFGALCSFLKNGTCSRTIMTILNRAFDHPQPWEEKASDLLAGGLMQGYQCGMLWGGSLAAGAQAYRLYGAGAAAEAAALTATKNLVEIFREKHNTIDCFDITETNPQDKWQVFVHFFLKGGSVSCARRVIEFAPMAARKAWTTFDQNQECSACNNGGNCAAQLMRIAGASELHSVMAAGFAGGLGLSGGGCGALGAAIWLTAMNGGRDGRGPKELTRRVNTVTETFLKQSNYTYECEEIAGRRFQSAADHGQYVTSGGCGEIISVLAKSLIAQKSDCSEV